MFDMLANFVIEAATMMKQATTGSPELDSIVSIVLAVGAIAGVIGTFMSQFQKTKHMGQMLDTFSQKTVENEEVIRRGLTAVNEAVPEVTSGLKKYGADLEYINQRVTKGKEQLEFFRDVAVKGSSRADNVTELPREDKKVFGN